MAAGGSGDSDRLGWLGWDTAARLSPSESRLLRVDRAGLPAGDKGDDSEWLLSVGWMNRPMAAGGWRMRVAWPQILLPESNRPCSRCSECPMH